MKSVLPVVFVVVVIGLMLMGLSAPNTANIIFVIICALLALGFWVQHLLSKDE